METNNKRIIAFQGLRGYAILMVFISHCNYLLNDYGKNIFTHLGGLGVSIFVMLSGYLLAFQNHESTALISMDKIKNSLKRFYPLHIVTIIISLPFCIGAFLHEDAVKQTIKLILNALLVQAWVPSSGVFFSFNAVSWYLSLTMFFVIVGPITLKLINRIRINAVPFLLAGILLFEYIWCFAFQNKSFAHWIIYILPAVRYFDYMAGGAVLKVVDSYKSKKNYAIFSVLLFGMAILLASLLIVLSLNSNSEYFSVAVWFIPTIMMISAAALGDGASRIIDVIFSNKVIKYIGNISFEFFLIHQLVIRYLTSIFSKLLNYRGLFIYIFSFFLSFICAEVWRIIIKNRCNGGSKQ